MAVDINRLVPIFQQIGFGAIAAPTPHGTMIFIHADRLTIKDCLKAHYEITLESFPYQETILLLCGITCFDTAEDPFQMTCIIDPAHYKPHELNMLATQDHVYVAWLDENMVLVRIQTVAWDQTNQQTVQSLLLALEELAAGTTR